MAANGDFGRSRMAPRARWPQAASQMPPGRPRLGSRTRRLTPLSLQRCHDCGQLLRIRHVAPSKRRSQRRISSRRIQFAYRNTHGASRRDRDRMTHDLGPLCRSTPKARIATAICIAPDVGQAPVEVMDRAALDRVGAAVAFPTLRGGRHSTMRRQLTWCRADGTCSGGSSAV